MTRVLNFKCPYDAIKTIYGILRVDTFFLQGTEELFFKKANARAPKKEDKMLATKGCDREAELTGGVRLLVLEALARDSRSRLSTA